MTHEDARNVIDEFKGMSEAAIIEALDRNGTTLEVAIENTLRDFNMGSVVRSANAFGVRHLHIVGRRQWNKRGAMMTDKYLHIHYHDSFDALKRYASGRALTIVAVDNVPGAIPLQEFSDRPHAIMLFGQEGPGLSPEAISSAEHTLSIEQNGSTRSLNVAVAAGVAMYTWLQSV